MRCWVENVPFLRHIARVKLKFLSALLLAMAILAGCSKPAPPPPAPKAVTIADNSPTQAQPKLQTMKLYVGPEIVDAELALTSDEIRCGMMFRTNIQETDAMLFNLRYPQQADFWMKNCPESISVAYIAQDGTIRDIHHLEANDTNGVLSTTDDIVFALETKEGWFARHNIGTNTVIRTEKGTLEETFLRGR
jgi:uncharacterized membrane protein (UPF0127 family)